MQLHFSAHTVTDKSQKYSEIAIISNTQEKLLQIRDLLDTPNTPTYLFLVGNAIFKQNIDEKIIFLENVSKIEEYFPAHKNRIYLACFG